MNELYRYLTLAVTPEWRRLPDHERASQKDELARAAEHPAVRVHAYSLVGTRGDADLLLWCVADDLADLRDLELRLAATRLWTFSTRPYAYLAARRRSPYLGEHGHDGSEHARGEAGPGGGTPYPGLYPLTKERARGAPPPQARTPTMAARAAAGDQAPAHPSPTRDTVRE